MVALRIRGALSLGCIVALAAGCGSTAEPTPTEAASSVKAVSGYDQAGLVGQALPTPLVVKVSTNGTAVKGATVNFAVTSGTATVNPASAVTDTDGQARTLVTLGASPGTITVLATVAGTALTTEFVVTAGTSTRVLACTSAAGTTPALGSVQAAVGGTGICLGAPAGASAEYALVAFYGNADSASVANSAAANFTVTGRGATAVFTPSIAASLATTPGASVPQRGFNNRREEFDARLRATARRDLTPMFASARQLVRQRPSFNAIPANPAIGSQVTLNSNGQEACRNAKNRTGRVAAVSNTAIVVADVDNPTGGFTDAEYLSFATMFDTLINPLDVANFGTPSDVDKNAKIVMFFTKEVNTLTPRGSTGGTIGGFFYERDLFPLVDTGDLRGCAGSNFAEMFYVLVPDPSGTFGKPQQKADVLDVTPGTIAHEYQHLINAGRRLYVNDAPDFEEVWLNEGLSHVAEELLYYHVSRTAPRQNLGITQIRADVNAFNNLQGDNNGRYQEFIGMPPQTSVYGDNDNLETRGATWNLLRYLADHRGSADGDAWQQLVNTKLMGLPNLAHVFGSNYLTQIRDWTTSVFSDDVAGVTDARFLQPSWNMRNIFPALVNPSTNQPLGRFPLAVVPLSDASPANLTVVAGGAAYIRFAVPGGTQASIDWTAGGLPVSGLVQFTVVRTK